MGIVEQLIIDEGLAPQSNCPFKGNMNIKKLEECIQKYGPEQISFVRMEAGTNLVSRLTIFSPNFKRS